jgi:hypothetical protein
MRLHECIEAGFVKIKKKGWIKDYVRIEGGYFYFNDSMTERPVYTEDITYADWEEHKEKVIKKAYALFYKVDYGCGISADGLVLDSEEKAKDKCKNHADQTMFYKEIEWEEYV